MIDIIGGDSQVNSPSPLSPPPPSLSLSLLTLSQSRSFSLLYSGRSLDIVCKDKREYEVWTKGLQVIKNQYPNTAQEFRFFSYTQTLYTHTYSLYMHTHSHTCIHVQALLEGFSDHHAVENYISQNVRGRLQTDGEKIKVDIGTLRTKVLVQESKRNIDLNLTI